MPYQGPITYHWWFPSQSDVQATNIDRLKEIASLKIKTAETNNSALIIFATYVSTLSG